MKKLYILFFGIFLITGCSAMQGLVKPELTLLKANEDVNAVKVAGDIAPIKAPINAELENQASVGVGNTLSKTNTSVGGNQTNDSEVIKATLTTYKELSERYIKLQENQASLFFRLMMFFMTTTLGVLVWIIKFLLKSDKERDLRDFKKNEGVKKNV